MAIKGIEHIKLTPKAFNRELMKAFTVNDKRRFKQKKAFSASLLGYNHGRCSRYWNFAWQGAEFDDQPDIKSKINMLIGIELHELFQRIIEDDANIRIIDIERELKTEDPPIHGFVDGVFSFMGEDIVWEFKTARTESYAWKVKKNKPSKSHIVQVLLYIIFTGVERGFVTYLDKNESEVYTVEVRLDEYKDYADYLLGWMRKVRKAYDEEKMPNRGFRRDSKTCNNCPVEAICDMTLQEDVEIERLSLPE